MNYVIGQKSYIYSSVPAVNIPIYVNKPEAMKEFRVFTLHAACNKLIHCKTIL